MFFYNTFGCDPIVVTKFIKNKEEVEINPDSLRDSTSHLSKHLRPQDTIKGFEYTAIFESVKDCCKNQVVAEIREQARQLLAMGA